MADDLPSAYEPARITPTTTWIILRIDDCDHASADRIDIGPASIVGIGVPVLLKDAPSNESAKTMVYSIEIDTNSPELFAWFNAQNATVALRSVSHSTTILAQDYARMEGEITGPSATVYSYVGAASTQAADEHDEIRLYYGPDPTQDYWDTEVIFSQSMGDGQAILNYSATSRVADMLQGTPALSAFIGVREASLHVFRGSDAE